MKIVCKLNGKSKWCCTRPYKHTQAHAFTHTFSIELKFGTAVLKPVINMFWGVGNIFWLWIHLTLINSIEFLPDFFSINIYLILPFVTFCRFFFSNTDCELQFTYVIRYVFFGVGMFPFIYLKWWFHFLWSSTWKSCACTQWHNHHQNDQWIYIFCHHEKITTSSEELYGSILWNCVDHLSLESINLACVMSFIHNFSINQSIVFFVSL